MNYRKWIPLIVISILLPIIWYAINSTYPSSIAELKNLIEQIRNYGSILSLIGSLYILYIINFPKMIAGYVELSKDSAWKFVFFGLGLIALIGVWFAVRAIGFILIDFLVDETKIYKIETIFDVISYLLTANFSFTLIRTFEKIGCKNEEQTENPKEGEQIVPKLIDLFIQGLLITLIAYVPRYSVEVLDGRFIEFVILTLLFLFSALALLFYNRKCLE